MLQSLIVVEGQRQSSPWLQLNNQVYLGDDEVMAQMIALIDADKERDEIPLSQRWLLPKALALYK